MFEFPAQLSLQFEEMKALSDKRLTNEQEQYIDQKIKQLQQLEADKDRYQLYDEYNKEIDPKKATQIAQKLFQIIELIKTIVNGLLKQEFPELEWEMKTGELTEEDIIAENDSLEEVFDLAYSADGKTVFAFATRDFVFLGLEDLNKNKLSEIKKIKINDLRSDSAVSFRGDKVMFIDRSNYARVYDSQTQQQIADYKLSNEGLVKGGFSADADKIILLGSKDGKERLEIIDITQTENYVPKKHFAMNLDDELSNYGIAVNSANNQFVISSEKKSLKGNLDIYENKKFPVKMASIEISKNVHQIIFNLTGKQMAIMTANEIIFYDISDPKQGTPVLKKFLFQEACNSMCLNPDATKLAITIPGDNCLVIYDVSVPGQLQEIVKYKYENRVGPIQFSPDGKNIMFGDINGNIKIFDLQQ